MQKGAGDFSQTAYEIISERTVMERGKYTVDQVNQKLDELARASGEYVSGPSFEKDEDELTTVGLRSGKNKVLSALYNNLSAQEQKWLIRIILKGASPLPIQARQRRDGA